MPWWIDPTTVGAALVIYGMLVLVLVGHRVGRVWRAFRRWQAWRELDREMATRRHGGPRSGSRG